MAQTTKWASLNNAFIEAKETTELYTEYAVGNNDVITLSLKFGTTGVMVNTNIRLRRTFIIEDETDDIKNFPIGEGKEIKGATMVIYSLLTRTAAMGDSKTLKVTITLKGGKDYQQTIQHVVAGNDSTMFRIEVFFTN